MRKLFPAAVIILALCIMSAGCLSFSSTTADIVIGDQKVGQITFTPDNSKLFSDASLDEKFSVEIELFGVKYAKDELTLTEKNELLAAIGMGDLESLNLKDFEKTENESIFDAIANMKLSAESDKTLAEALEGSGESIGKTVENFEELFS